MIRLLLSWQPITASAGGSHVYCELFEWEMMTTKEFIHEVMRCGIKVSVFPVEV